MTAAEIYRRRRDEYAQRVTDLEGRDRTLSALRLGVFLVAVAVVCLLGDAGRTPALIAGILFLIVFVILVVRHERVASVLAESRQYRDLNAREAAKLHGDHAGLDPGLDLPGSEDDTAGDLDLFGPVSLYSYLSRAETRDGRETLAAWFRLPAEAGNLRARQEAVAELAPLLDYRQKLQVTVRCADRERTDSRRLASWVNIGSRLPQGSWLPWFAFLLPLTTLASLIAGFSGYWSPGRGYGLLGLVLQFLVILVTERRVGRFWRASSGSAPTLWVLSALALLVEGREFQAPLLVRIREEFGRGAGAATARIRRVARCLDWLDLRRSIIHFPINLLFFYDLHFVLALDRERRVIGEKLAGWFAGLGQLEALASLALVVHDHPDWCLPEILDEPFGLEAEDLGHPLLPDERRVGNDFRLSGRGSFQVLTGSNMAGKSTFLRSVGLAMVMASAGGPVAARCCRLSPVPVLAAMSARDSLERGVSSFLAELQRLRSVLDAAYQGPILALLDEMLKGTHSADQYRGSLALLRQLHACGAAVLVATHDLSLAETAETLPGWQGNICLVGDVTDTGDLCFDYRLRPGIGRSHTALALMQRLGFNLEAAGPG